MYFLSRIIYVNIYILYTIYKRTYTNMRAHTQIHKYIVNPYAFYNIFNIYI